ncbi:hypothetical protein [Aliikangiella sp. IMCC44359]|uniref:hypothetical protein n=1 Tax=Aliikangiella sp. IMCC44359 TaxID=3459125 RepID=UPI00403AA6FD
MEPEGKPNINKTLNAFAILMLFPVLLSLYGIYGYQTSTSQYRMESLYFVGFMGAFSVLVFIPYCVVLMRKWNNASVTNITVSSIPFVGIALMYWYALNEGAPF